MYQVYIRDLLWLTLVIGLSIALWMERTRSHEVTVAAANSRKYFEKLATFAVEREDWKIICGSDFLKIYWPGDDLDHPALYSTWIFHQYSPSLNPIDREWSRRTLEGEWDWDRAVE
jgi:hypothetical protein